MSSRIVDVPGVTAPDSGALQPGLVVLDDTFTCQSFPNLPRVGLRNLHELQKAMQPQKSVLLAPGESIDVSETR